MKRRSMRPVRHRHTNRLWYVLIALIFAAAAGLWTSGGRLGAQTSGPCAPPNGNPVVCENQLAGSPESEWDITGAGDPSIQGFATDISVNRGQTVSFKIDTSATNYRLDIYRMGYYGGMGARKVASVNPSVSLPQSQPNCLTDAATGLIDCGNWAVSATWAVPSTAVSGIYFAKAIRTDTGGASHIIFIVRDDASTADLLFQTSDTTWQAYNRYGGNSLYDGGPGTNPGRAYKVSYNRPFSTRGSVPEDWVFNAEYPMVRFLEANGYNVAYITGVDTDRLNPAILRQHRVFLSVGHDEYWSATQRANVEAARAAGVHLAFFSGNEVFWKTRWENSIAAGGSAYRTLVSYKETHADANIDPNAAWTGTWRDPRFSPPADGGRPENALTGTIFMVNGSSDSTFGIRVPAAEGKMRFWRNTSIANLGAGQTTTLPLGTLGYEWDSDLDNGFRPAGLVRLSDSTYDTSGLLQDHGSTYAFGTANHALTLYRHPSGALVFGAGTVQWTWGLDSNHDRGSTAPSVPMRQATVNLFADMGVQPLTIQSGLVTATASTDTLAPTAVITSPANGGSVPVNATVNIIGTATDNGGGQVGGVELSFDGGATWRPAAGRANWSYQWQTGGSRTVTIMVRAADDSANLQQVANSITIAVGSGSSACPCTIWPNTASPTQVTEEDPSAIELGTKFRSDINGYVTAIRFYKGPQNVGPHVGRLWTAGGANLATVTFSGETASGWQQAILSSPVAITANTTYVVSYHTASGYYSQDVGYFTGSSYANGPLQALEDGVDGNNGLYRYGASGFPTGSFQGSNYWVDVVFATTVAPDTTAPVVSTTNPTNGASGVAATSPVVITFSEVMSAATINGSTIELRNSSNSLVTSTVTYAGTTATVQPTAALAYSSTYSVRIRGGASGVKDAANNPLAADFNFSFVTQSAPPPPPTTGPGGPILVVTASANPFSQYYAEILRNEGLNAFTVADLSTVTATMLNSYDVVILGNIPLSTTQVTMFTNWVTAGGNLIAMRPDTKLASLLGLSSASSTLAEGYLLVNTATAPGAGIVGQTMQYHGTADRYNLSGATSVATLYSSATTATSNPAVTVRSVGSAGGQAVAFTYDLARSVVFTRQGNPSWSGQERDGQAPIRSDDLFFGGSSANYVNLAKVAIPQADEQQRLLANVINFVTRDRKPLPKFWYFPNGHKAVVVMTGDDHNSNGTSGRFDIYNANSPQGCNVANWECVRATSYIWPDTPITPGQVADYVAQGFEVGVHVWMSGIDGGFAFPDGQCYDYTSDSIGGDYQKQLAVFAQRFPAALPVRTNRTHCIVWSDYDTQPLVSLANGIRLDTNYYYWPPNWINNVPGLFTGSAMPMRFAKADGTMIDVYQATTQMTDESGQTYPFTAEVLLDRAIGPEGYFGAFVANMHTDAADHDGSEGIVSAAQLRGVPIISAKQLLTWLDARNASSFQNIAWNGTSLSYTVSAATGSNGLQTMLPASFNGHALTGLTRNGAPVTFTTQVIKGLSYAVFVSAAGNYVAQYAQDSTAPVISSVVATPNSGSATISWTTNEQASTRVDFGLSAGALTTSAVGSGLSTNHSVVISGLNPTTTYYYRVSSSDLSNNTAAFPVAPSAANFTTVASPYSCPCSVWPANPVPSLPGYPENSAVELGLKWRSLTDGFVTGVRFYKSPLNTGTHTGSLWSSTGARLATVTFDSETAAGWQQAFFDVPVGVTANTTYVISYHTDAGNFAADVQFFASNGVASGPLQALASGVDGQNGVFKYGASAFPSESFESTNYWVDVMFSTSATPDTTAPTVVSVAPANGSTTAPIASPITAAFSERLKLSTVTTSTFVLRNAQNVVVPAVVSFTSASNTATLQPTGPLPNSSAFTATLVGGANGITDAAGNPLASNVVWSFTTQALSVTDTTVADFNAGTVAASAVTQVGDGAVILAPSISADFSGTELPSGWSVAPWVTGGTAVVANDAVVVDGARASVDALLQPGISLEFAATFTAEGFQHAGLGLTFDETPWAMFSTGSGGGLFARTHDGVFATNTGIPGNWLGASHVYRIDWNANTVTYWIDGVQVLAHNHAIGGQMRPIVSDFALSGTGLRVDWLRSTPYVTSGTFTSRILTPGGMLNWTTASWTAALPAATTMDVAVRFGNTPTPDATWTAFTDIASSGSALSQSSVYLQYRVQFAGSGGATPSLNDITFSGVQPPPPTISINDVTASEGDSGITNMVFTVSTSYPSTNQLQVNYATANGTASSANDYTTTTGTLTIPSGQTSATIAVPIIGDTSVEANETLTLTLSAPVNATIADNQGIGTIVNDDQVRVSVANLTVNEPSGSTATAQFTVSLSQASTSNISVTYATANDTATAGADYNALAATVLTFTPGQVSRTVSVTILGDSLDEDNETFFVNLTNPVGAALGTAQGIVTIVDNDSTPDLTVNNVTVTEGTNATAVFTVSLSPASGREVRINYTTANGSAVAPGDYTTTAGTLTFPAGTTSQQVVVPIINDTVDEPTQTFTVSLSGAVNADIADGQGTGTINDNDNGSATLAINNASVIEGDSGTRNITFTVTLTGATEQTVGVTWTTQNGTASGGWFSGDFVTSFLGTASGTLSFSPGTTTQTINVQVRGDNSREANETFNVNLSNASNATIADGTGVGTITNDD